MNEMMKMKQMVDSLNQASDAYYRTGHELMSNKQYDDMYHELEKLEHLTGVVMSDSPTQKVGAEPVDELPKTTHEYMALSLDKTKEVQEYVSKFVKGTEQTTDKRVVVMWKLDGGTLQLTYENGMLHTAATRGNGLIGSDISHNIPFIHGIPMQIPYKGKLVVRGEAVMSYKEFERINENLLDDEKYKNPRNLANATISMHEPLEVKKRRVDFQAFALVYADDMPQTFENRLNFLETNGFNVVQHQIASVNELNECLKAWEADTMEYPVDGLVTVLNDISYAETLQGTGHHPHVLNGYALKWSDDLYETTLKDIEWSASRTGRINPVAVFEAVDIEGSTIQRATLHNLSIIQELGLGYNDTITIYKANKVIPAVHENLTRNGNLIPVPTKCPVCGAHTERRMNAGETSEFLYCMNPECPAKHVGRFKRLVERDALDLRGVSDATIELFVSKGWLKEPADIFSLSSYKSEIMEMEGFGKKSYDNLMVALETAKKTTFRQFFYALGIPNAGHDAGKILEKETPAGKRKTEFLLELADSENGFEVLRQMDGFGGVIAGSIIEYVRKYRTEVLHLLSHLVIDDDEVIEDTNELSLKGLVFVVTGKLNTYQNRDALKAEIESKGGKVSGSVSSKTNYLINNDVTSTSGKNKKAKELGVTIISEEDYKRL